MNNFHINNKYYENKNDKVKFQIYFIHKPMHLDFILFLIIISSLQYEMLSQLSMQYILFEILMIIQMLKEVI